MSSELVACDQIIIFSFMSHFLELTAIGSNYFVSKRSILLN